MDGSEIKAIREHLNWSQAKMAEYLRVAQPTVHRMEKGQKPRTPVLKAIQALIDQSDREQS